MENIEFLENCKSSYWLKTTNKKLHRDVAEIFDSSKFKVVPSIKKKEDWYSYSVYIDMQQIWRELILLGKLSKRYSGVAAHFMFCHQAHENIESFKALFPLKKYEFDIFDNINYKFDAGFFYFRVSEFRPRSTTTARYINEVMLAIRANPLSDLQKIPIYVMNEIFGINLYIQFQFVQSRKRKAWSVK